MLEQLVKVVCDTSFIISFLTKKIKNINSFEAEIGPIQFVIPTVVQLELKKLMKNQQKVKKISYVLEHIKNMKTIDLTGNFADKSLLDYVKKNKGIVATLDKKLKEKIKKEGGSVLSLTNDRIVLEP